MWLRKMKKYTKNEFLIVLAIACFFTVLYLFAGYIMWIDVPDAVRVTSECVGILFPIILLMSWYMCVERYVSIAYQLKENKENKGYMLQVIIRIILMFIGGINVYRSILSLLIYPLSSLNTYMDNYEVGYAIKISLAVAWIVFLAFNFSIRKISANTKYGKLIVAVILLVVILLWTEVAEGFMEEWRTQAWIQKMNSAK